MKLMTKALDNARVAKYCLPGIMMPTRNRMKVWGIFYIRKKQFIAVTRVEKKTLS